MEIDFFFHGLVEHGTSKTSGSSGGDVSGENEFGGWNKGFAIDDLFERDKPVEAEFWKFDGLEFRPKKSSRTPEPRGTIFKHAQTRRRDRRFELGLRHRRIIADRVIWHFYFYFYQFQRTKIQVQIFINNLISVQTRSENLETSQTRKQRQNVIFFQ